MEGSYNKVTSCNYQIAIKMHLALIKITYQSLKHLFDCSCNTLEFHGFKNIFNEKIREYILQKNML